MTILNSMTKIFKDSTRPYVAKSNQRNPNGFNVRTKTEVWVCNNNAASVPGSTRRQDEVTILKTLNVDLMF